MTLRNFFLLNKTGRELAKTIITSEWLHENPFYKRIYKRHIKKEIDKLERIYSGITVETTNACNAKCIMCARKRMKRPVGFMDWDLFTRVIDDACYLGFKEVTLSFFGEPLLDKKIVQRVEYVKSKGMKTTMFSNGQLMNETKSRQLVAAGLDKLTVSIDGISQETYGSIRKNLDIGTVTKNIKFIADIADSAGKPEITISCLRMKRNEHEFDSVFSFWNGQKGITNVLIADVRDWAGGGTDERQKIGRFQRPDLWIPPCRQLWQSPRVLVDGRVILCCDDAVEGEMSIGDMNKKSLEEILKGDEIRILRELHEKGHMNEIPLCRKCKRFTVWW